MKTSTKNSLILGIHSGVFFATTASILLFSGIAFSPISSGFLILNVATFGTMTGYFFLDALYSSRVQKNGKPKAKKVALNS